MLRCMQFVTPVHVTARMPIDGNARQELPKSSGSFCRVNTNEATGTFGRLPTSTTVPCTSGHACLYHELLRQTWRASWMEA